MRLFYTVLVLTLCLVLSGSVLGSPDTQTPPATLKPLTNADVLDMLKAGFSQEIIIVEIRASACEFDTEPAALKVLKIAGVPDGVILAMVQAPSGLPTQGRDSVASTLPSVQETTNAELSAPARVDCINEAGPISIYSAPYAGPDSVEVFKVKCGDRIILLNLSDKQRWLKIRTSDGQVGYISVALVSREQSAESIQEVHPSSEPRKREDIQNANDNLEDCKLRAQNEYDTKMKVIASMALAPMTRVAVSSRLKRNLDAEVRECRSQYELSLKDSDHKN
jgi:hypothetical protein